MGEIGKVLFINTICGTGSTGRLVTGLMDALNERGIDTMCAYGRWNAPKKYKTYRIGNNLDVIVHGMVSRITDRHGLYSTFATMRLIKEIKKYDPDVIHIHNVHGYYLNYKVLFKYLKTCNKRIIWTLHDCWSFTGHCSHFAYVECEKWRTECSRCPQLDQYPKSFLFDRSDKNYNLKKSLFTGIENLSIVTPSAWLAGMVKKSFLKEYPVEVVPTGINLARFKPRSSNLRERYDIGDRTLILGVANPWRERKGFDEFMKLAAELDDNYRIVMIGLKKKQLEGLAWNIIGIEKTDSVEEMAQWYSTADVYLNMTFEDTFPTTNLEAMACGTPVITYNVGGSPESLTSRTGIVVDPGDINGVKEAIQRVEGKNKEITERFCTAQAQEYSTKKRFEEYITKVYGLH
ncbi:Glycosyltransferase involved in cell wall bisynthesis [Lachnospiraceae bacterium KH1T2]|nr:Glycosyltransferase involved in cell wall bisynthesis [Lachnospiraceae bacterium KH1T2]